MIGFPAQLGNAQLGRVQLGNVPLSGGTVTTTQTITGISRITGITTRTIDGVANILGTTTRTIEGVAAIATTTTVTIDGRAFILAAEGRCAEVLVFKIVPAGLSQEPTDGEDAALVANLEPCERKGS